MICNECETVAYCTKNGCVPKTTKKDEAMKLALEAIEEAETGHAAQILREALKSVPDWASEAIEQPSGVATIAPVQQEPVGEVKRYGRDSHGRQWHGIYWYDPNVDVPHGTKLYTSPQPAPVQQEPVGRVCFEGDEVVWTDDTPESGTLLYTSPQPAPVQQAPMAWLVYENWRKHSLFFTKEGAEDFKNASQRNDDISGNLARWKTEPLYTSPPTLSLEQRHWEGLTDEELRQVWYDDAPVEGGTYIDKLRQVEAKLKAKNSP